MLTWWRPNRLVKRRYMGLSGILSAYFSFGIIYKIVLIMPLVCPSVYLSTRLHVPHTYRGTHTHWTRNSMVILTVSCVC